MPDIFGQKLRSAEALPENKIESQSESPEKKVESTVFEKMSEPAASAATPVSQVTRPYVLVEPILFQKKVESILEEGLAPLFMELSPQDQTKFKILGENTANKITSLLQQAKFKISEILILIKQWLMSIAGINKYYVEQEAKIKTEKILKLRQEK